MNNDLDNLFKLTPDYIEKACKVAGNAFQDDPATIFIYPDEIERKKKLKYGFKMLYTYGIKNGETYATSNNLEGITIWLPPNKMFMFRFFIIDFNEYSPMEPTIKFNKSFSIL